jgi:sugar lactone lactonase YvrE
VLLLGLAATAAHAVSTRHFTLDSESTLSAGELDGTAVLSTGAVVASVETRRLGLDNVGVARCMLRLGDDSLLIGTGNDGKIYRVRGDDVRELADTGEVMVNALVAGPGGIVYAATMPHGKIFSIDPSKPPTARKAAKAKPANGDDAEEASTTAKDGGGADSDVEPPPVFAELKGAEHVWALVYDRKRKTLYAATGPEGQVFAIDGKGNAEVYYDSDASHVMTLARDARGRLYAGTSDEALLLRLRGAGRAEVLHDFEGNEITALAVADGRIAVAANHFPKTPARKAKGKGKASSAAKSSAAARKSSKHPKPGKGALWVVDAAGRARELWSSDSGHITALQWDDSGAIYAATGKEGHIHRVQPDGTHALWIDVDERQVLSMDMTGSAPVFTTGDAGALYRVIPGRAKNALWTSKVLDASFRARWGQLAWRGRGNLSLQTRSGNTEKPDASWSDWSSVLTRSGPIRSAPARFLQVRARLGQGDDTVLYAVMAYYLPDNQPAHVTAVTVNPKKPKKKGSATPAPTPIYSVDWKVDNPDDDRLRYRLHFRPEGRQLWRPILEESQVLTSSKYEWDTRGIPDGIYRLRVELTDALENPEAIALEDHGDSEPFLLDNHPPSVDGLRYAGSRILGTARDALGPISDLEYSVDGEDWKPMYPVDDLFDTRVERFELTVPELGKGAHVISVRARDARHNAGTAEIWFTL